MLPHAFAVALLVLLAAVPTEEGWRVGRFSVGVDPAAPSFNGPHEGFATLGDKERGNVWLVVYDADGARAAPARPASGPMAVRSSGRDVAAAPYAEVAP
jgi:hypothetical protein